MAASSSTTKIRECATTTRLSSARASEALTDNGNRRTSSQTRWTIAPTVRSARDFRQHREPARRRRCSTKRPVCPTNASVNRLPSLRTTCSTATAPSPARCCSARNPTLSRPRRLPAAGRDDDRRSRPMSSDCRLRPWNRLSSSAMRGPLVWRRGGLPGHPARAEVSPPATTAPVSSSVEAAGCDSSLSERRSPFVRVAHISRAVAA